MYYFSSLMNRSGTFLQKCVRVGGQLLLRSQRLRPPFSPCPRKIGIGIDKNIQKYTNK